MGGGPHRSDAPLAVLRISRAPSRTRPTGRRARVVAEAAREEPSQALTPADLITFPPRGLAPPRPLQSVRHHIKALKSPPKKRTHTARRKLPNMLDRLLLMAAGLLPPALSQAVRPGQEDAHLAVPWQAVQRRAARPRRYRYFHTLGLK